MVGEGPGGGARILKPFPVPRAATSACVSFREQVWGWLVRAAVSVSHSSRAVFTKSITCFTTLLWIFICFCGRKQQSISVEI